MFVHTADKSILKSEFNARMRFPQPKIQFTYSKNESFPVLIMKKKCKMYDIKILI